MAQSQEGNQPHRHMPTDWLDFEYARHAAVAAAKAAQRVVALGLLAAFDQDEYAVELVQRPSIMSQAPDHPGDPADWLDFDARKAAQETLQEHMSISFGVDPTNLIFCGEEAPDINTRVGHGDFLCRIDALDGTKNSLAFWTGYSSVICIDQARIYPEVPPRARHLGGAIATPHGIVSWTNTGSFDRKMNRYGRVNGKVFFEHPLYMDEREILSRSWSTRATNVVASVAHDDDRYWAARKVMDDFGIRPERFYTAGGTPLAPALIGGQLSALVEPHNVTLHDSALLMPHFLLQGKISTPVGADLDYLALYESNGLNLNPNHRPVPGYIAWGGPHQ